MQYCDDDRIALNGKVNGVGKTAQQRSPHYRPEMLVLERILDDSVIGSAQFDEELQAKPGLLAFVPLDRRLDIEVRLWSRYETLCVADASSLDRRVHRTPVGLG